MLSNLFVDNMHHIPITISFVRREMQQSNQSMPTATFFRLLTVMLRQTANYVIITPVAFHTFVFIYAIGLPRGPHWGLRGLPFEHSISVIVFSFDRLNQTQYIIKKIIQGHNGTHTMLIQDYTILTSCTNLYEQSQSTCSLRANTFTPVVMYYKRRNNITVKYAWQLHVLRLPRN